MAHGGSGSRFRGPWAVLALGLLEWAMPAPLGAQSCVPPSFTNGPSFGLASPGAVVAGDFDRDGMEDVLAANVTGKLLRFFRGLGNGNLAPAAISPTDDPPGALVTGDFDRDGILDVVVVFDKGAANDVLAFMRGGGGGAFGPPVPIVSGGDYVALLAGSFKDPSHLDLVVSDATGALRFIGGRGDGTFEPAGTIANLSGLGELAAGDFNRNGDLDLLVAVDKDVHRYYGRGDSTFTLDPASPLTSTSGAGTPGMVVADFDRDGWPDAAVLDPDASQVQLLRNDGGGGVIRTGEVAFGDGSTIAVGDFDANGIPDLAVGRRNPTPWVFVRLGDGTGAFPKGSSTSIEGPATALAVASLRGDGRADLVAGTLANTVSVRPNFFGFSCPASSFGKAARSFRAPYSPFFVARGDFNGDGRPDLAVTSTDGLLQVYRGSDGDFGFPTIIPVSTALAGVVALDFDLDGKADVAVADYAGNQMAVLKGNGAFGFAAPVTAATGAEPTAIVAGDFDRNGKPDLATADYTGNTVTLAFGDGTGGFASTSPLTGLSGPASLAVADLDLDGNPDLAVANETGGTVSLFKGDGTGGFSTFTPLTGLTTPRWLVVTDLNRDGKPDLVVAERAGDRVMRYLGNGDGSFGAGASTPAGDEPVFLTDGDFTGEGAPDVAVVNLLASTVTVLRGDGGGNLLAGPSFPTGASPYSLAVVDYNRDGHEDLAVANTGSQSLSVLAGNGDLTFDAASAFDSSPTGTFQRAAIADVDRDGRLDVLVTDGALGQVRFYRGDGLGAFAPPVPSAGLALGGGALAVADFDGNGTLDVVVGETNRVHFGLGLGGGTFSPLGALDTPLTPVSIAPGDFDRDGKLDLAVGNGEQVTVAYGNGSGGFGGSVHYTLGFPGDEARSVVTTDFNRDGILDLVVVVNRSQDRLYLLRGNPGGTFTQLGETHSVGDEPESIAVADLNRDGVPDLAVAHRGPGMDMVALFVGRVAAPPYFEQPPSPFVAVGREPRVVLAADVNADGIPDLVTANTLSASLTVALGTGTGAFGSREDWEVLGDPTALAAGDVDRDGKPDFVSLQRRGAPPRFVSVLLNTNCAARRLRVQAEPSSCNAEGQPFLVQPQLGVHDDGGNLVGCDAGALTAARVPGTGNPAGAVVGTQPVGVSFGGAAFADLAFDAPGRRYRVGYAHAPAGATARSRFVNVGASLAAIGPTQVCEGVSATWDAGPGWDTVEWRLDGAPVGTGQTLTRALAAGLYTLRVDTTLDGCMDGTSIAVTSSSALSAASISVAGSTVFCPSCSGGTATVTTTGGGPATFQWGWRATSGGAFNPILGATSAAYGLSAAHFGGAPGAYYLVARVTPLCGSPTFSNEVKVVLFTVTAGNDVPFLTTTSRSGETRVEWMNPALPYEDTLVRFGAVSGTATCAPPANPGAGTQLALVTGAPGGKDGAPHTGLLDDNTTYCYRVFVHKGGGVMSPGRDITGRPFDTAGPVKWAFNTGAFAMVTPGNGAGRVHVATMDNSLHSAAKGAGGGIWPPSWTPRPLAGPSQGRASTVAVPSPVNGASRLLFLGTQGSVVHAIDADTGAAAWSTPLPAPAPAPVQATVSGYFTFFTGLQDFLLVGTRNGGLGVQNRFYALRLSNGSEAWSYDGSADGRKIGMIAGQASVDYAGGRVYFASAAFGAAATEKDTVWCLDVVTGARIWSVELADVTVSPIVRGGRVYVASYNGAVGGQIHALDAVTGASVWGGTYATGIGEEVKTFVGADRLSGTGRLIFSTTNKVWALDDPAGSTSPPAGWVWRRDALSEAMPIPNPSTPTYIAGGPHLWVGSSDGKLHRLDYWTGATQLSLPLGDTLVAAAVGAPTIDLAQGFLYVGTLNGNVYAALLP